MQLSAIEDQDAPVSWHSCCIGVVMVDMMEVVG